MPSKYYLLFLGVLFSASYYWGNSNQQVANRERVAKQNTPDGSITKRRRNRKRKSKTQITKVSQARKAKNISILDLQKTNQERMNSIAKQFPSANSKFTKDFLYYSEVAIDETTNEVREYDQELHMELEKEFRAELNHSPDELYDSLKSVAEQLQDNPFEQSLLFEKMAAIPGKTEEVKTILHAHIDNTYIPKEKNPAELKTVEEELKNYDTSDKQLAYEKNFQTLQKITTDPEEKYDNVLNVFRNQVNTNVQRNIASDHLTENKADAPRLVEEIGLRKTNQLVPSNIIVKENEYGVIEVWDNIEPVERTAN